MQVDMPRRRVLVAAASSAMFSCRDLFSHESMRCWEPVETDSLSHAHFVMQHHPCDIMLVHEDLFCNENGRALFGLIEPREVPIVVLAGHRAETVTRAYQQGAHICLSRDLTASHPSVLAAALERAGGMSEQLRTCRQTQKQLAHSRRHLDRLVHLMWRSTPIEGETPWGTQRYTVERLHEEVARTQRHGGPFTVAVGEVTPDAEQPAPDDLMGWTADAVANAKRRCGVAGPYGIRGFLLLMVMTPKAGGMVCCRRLQRILQSTAKDKGPRGPLRACFGLAACSPENATPEALLRLADRNLEMARSGKGEGIVAE